MYIIIMCLHKIQRDSLSCVGDKNQPSLTYLKLNEPKKAYTFAEKSVQKVTCREGVAEDCCMLSILPLSAFLCQQHVYIWHGVITTHCI